MLACMQAAGVDAQLFRAAGETDDASVVRELLKQGASIEARDEDGDTPLILAARRGRLSVTRVLLSEGARVDATNLDGDTALMRAAWAGHLDLARLLLSAGASTQARDSAGDDALALARRQNHTAVVELLQHAEEAAGAERHTNLGCASIGGARSCSACSAPCHLTPSGLLAAWWLAQFGFLSIGHTPSKDAPQAC